MSSVHGTVEDKREKFYDFYDLLKYLVLCAGDTSFENIVNFCDKILKSKRL